MALAERELSWRDQSSLKWGVNLASGTTSERGSNEGLTQWKMDNQKNTQDQEPY